MFSSKIKFRWNCQEKIVKTYVVYVTIYQRNKDFLKDVFFNFEFWNFQILCILVKAYCGQLIGFLLFAKVFLPTCQNLNVPLTKGYCLDKKGTLSEFVLR